MTKATPENYFLYKISKYENNLLYKEIRIEPSPYQLHDKIYGSILNSKELDLKNYREKELQFMLVCANQLVNDIHQDLSSTHTNILTGFGLIDTPIF